MSRGLLTNGAPASSDEQDAPSVWERIELKSDHLEDAVERLVHAGTVRRIVVRKDDEVVAEFPVAVGVVGAVLAAPVVGIAAIVALLGDCTIDVERIESAQATGEGTASTGSTAADDSDVAAAGEVVVDEAAPVKLHTLGRAVLESEYHRVGPARPPWLPSR